ncbi:MAG: hypothetical protein WCK67_11865 [bacterium]
MQLVIKTTNNVQTIQKSNKNISTTYTSFKGDDYENKTVKLSSKQMKELLLEDNKENLLNNLIKRAEINYKEAINLTDDTYDKDRRKLLYKAHKDCDLALNVYDKYIDGTIETLDHKKQEELCNKDNDIFLLDKKILKELFKINMSPEALKQTNEYENYNQSRCNTDDWLTLYKEKFVDGFTFGIHNYDENACPTGASSIKYQTAIIIDATKDKILNNAINYIGEQFTKVENMPNTKKEKDLLKMESVLELMHNNFPYEEIIVSKDGHERKINIFSKRKHQPSRPFYIGNLISDNPEIGIKRGAGVCAEQAKLCKVLVERNAITANLVQSPFHAWLEVNSDGDKYVLDPANRLLIDLEEEKIYRYKPRDRKLIDITNDREMVNQFANLHKKKNGKNVYPQIFN